MVAPNDESAPTAAGHHRIAILGAGLVGTALATQFVRAGYSVSISNSKGPGTLQKEEELTGATAMSVERAVSNANVVVLAIPSGNVVSLKPVLQACLRPGTVLVDSCNYYPSRDGHIEPLDDGMVDSVWVSETLSVSVVKAFNNIIAVNIVNNARPKGSPERVALPVSGDDDTAVALVVELVGEAGFDAFNAGRLIDSWRQQPGQPVYCTEPSLKQLPALLSSANREKAILKRDKGRAIVEKLPPDFSPQILLRISRLDAGMDWGSPRSWLAAIVFGFAILRSMWRRSP